MTTRRLRPVPEHAPPVLIDPPELPAVKGDWHDGFCCGREALHGELEAAYRRGLRQRPASTAIPLWVTLLVALAFIAGFVLGVWATT